MLEGISKPRRCTKTNRLKSSSQLRLEQNNEQDRNNIEHPVEDKADHVEAHNTAERYKDKDQNDTFDELPSTRLPDKQKDCVKQESYEKDICSVADEIPKTAEEQSTTFKRVEKLAYELDYLTDKSGIRHQSSSFGNRSITK